MTAAAGLLAGCHLIFPFSYDEPVVADGMPDGAGARLELD
jgi:hypothetical protein